MSNKNHALSSSSASRRRNKQSRGTWTSSEDEALTKAVEMHGAKNWKKIAESVPGRSDVQCLHRWQKVLNPELVKGPWTEEEDNKVRELVKIHGPKKWSVIASHLPGRIGKQCRERWTNHLDPAIKKGNWEPWEDDLIITLQREIGNKWARIAKQLQGRTDNAVKNRFNSTISRRIRQQRPTTSNKKRNPQKNKISTKQIPGQSRIESRRKTVDERYDNSRSKQTNDDHVRNSEEDEDSPVVDDDEYTPDDADDNAMGLDDEQELRPSEYEEEGDMEYENIDRRERRPHNDVVEDVERPDNTLKALPLPNQSAFAPTDAYETATSPSLYMSNSGSFSSPSTDSKIIGLSFSESPLGPVSPSPVGSPFPSVPIANRASPGSAFSTPTKFRSSPPSILKKRKISYSPPPTNGNGFKRPRITTLYPSPSVSSHDINPLLLSPIASMAPPLCSTPPSPEPPQKDYSRLASVRRYLNMDSAQDLEPVLSEIKGEFRPDAAPSQPCGLQEADTGAFNSEYGVEPSTKAIELHSNGRLHSMETDHTDKGLMTLHMMHQIVSNTSPLLERAQHLFSSPGRNSNRSVCKVTEKPQNAAEPVKYEGNGIIV